MITMIKPRTMLALLSKVKPTNETLTYRQRDDYLKIKMLIEEFFNEQELQFNFSLFSDQSFEFDRYDISVLQGIQTIDVVNIEQEDNEFFRIRELIDSTAENMHLITINDRWKSESEIKAFVELVSKTLREKKRHFQDQILTMYFGRYEQKNILWDYYTFSVEGKIVESGKSHL